jgi:hypothetical protein
MLRPLVRFVLLLAILVGLGLAAGNARAAERLPRGDHRFRLGMSRAQVDSALTARRETVLSNGVGFLVTAGDDPLTEYVEYRFFRAPHGLETVWRVTIGCRIGASTAEFAAAREGLIRLLGEPASDSWNAGDVEAPGAAKPPGIEHSVAWGDGVTGVHLGGRWTDEENRDADRMKVTWTDRRLQRIVAANARKVRGAD